MRSSPTATLLSPWVLDCWTLIRVVSSKAILLEVRMKNGDIVGTWRLLSWELRDSDGHVSFPMGRTPNGRLTYTAEGFVSVLITGRNRQLTIPGDAGLGIPDAMITAARRSMSYAGSYERDGDGIVHHVEISSFPDWVGTAQERQICWQDGRLVLYTSPAVVGGKEQAAFLTWERLQSSTQNP